MKPITIRINNKDYSAGADESVLEVAIKNGIDIPHFCYHEDLPVDGNCRTCLVEIESEKGNKITTACTLKATDGLKVFTDSVKARKLRQKNLELLLAGHEANCPKCQTGIFCHVGEGIKRRAVSTTNNNR